MATPKIRIKGFEGEWKNYSLAEMGKCISGICFPEKEQNGNKGIPFYKVSDMNNIGNEKVMKISNNYVTSDQIIKNGWKICSDIPAIFFAKVGAAVLLNRKRLVLNPCLCDNNTMLYTIDQTKWDAYFCQSYFETIDLTKLVQVGSLPSYNANMVGKINVSLPTIHEQRQIASYFTSLDSLIQSTTKKIESLKQTKQACLQSMFPQEGETSPRVRFKGFEGEWKKVKLGQFAKKRTEKNSRMQYNITLTNSAELGIVNQRSFFDHDISNSNNIGGYYVVRNNDFVYNPRISSTAPAGPINVNKLGYTGIMSPLYLVFEVNEYDRSFLEIYFQTRIWHKHMFDNGNTGARFDRLAISEEDFFNMPIPDISHSEQRQIASFFTNLDQQISLQTQKLEKLKQVKAACLDKMFV